jgi:hypothetical protein
VSYFLSWTTPLSTNERRWLRAWIEKVTERHPEVIERRRGGIVINDSQRERVEAFARLTMAILGRTRAPFNLQPIPVAHAA